MNVPSPGSSWEEVSEFAVSWNGYERAGDFDAVAAIADGLLDAWHESGLIDASLEDLRTAFFFEQRRWRLFGYDPDETASRYIDALVSAIGGVTGGTIDGRVFLGETRVVIGEP